MKNATPLHLASSRSFMCVSDNAGGIHVLSHIAADRLRDTGSGGSWGRRPVAVLCGAGAAVRCATRAGRSVVCLSGSGAGGVADADVAGFEVFLDAFVSAFAADAGVLDATEGGGGVGDDPGVEAGHAGL